MAELAGAPWRRTIRARIIVTAAGFALWVAGIEARLVYLQVVQHAELVAKAARQQVRTISPPAKRGEILDRRGRVLALSVDADSIYAVPDDIDAPERVGRALCDALERCSPQEQQSLIERLRRRPRAFVYIRRQVSPEEARRVAGLNLAGVGFLKESRRYYPRKDLAAHLLGYVGVDNVGLAGLEAAYDAQIRGRAGKILIQTDARRHAFSRIERPPTTGASIELTIDEYIQHVAERELRAAVQANAAIGGSVIVMDPHTGEILALANEPTFNPNTFRTSLDVERRNRAVQDIYEPGSTFKIVTAAAALEENVVGLEEPIDVGDGTILLGSRRIDDVRPFDRPSFTEVIVQSSNVGVVKVGLKLGAECLTRYVHRFGFGRPTSSDLPGESAGIVWNPAKLDSSALASVSMGYQVGVTALQMVAAVSSIANGGELLQPSVVRAIHRGRVRLPVSRRVRRRTVSPETAAELTALMEAVVERGTGQAAGIPGYTAAGKTGTASKLIDGRYSKTDYNASFVGFVPSRRPVAAIIVVVDSPRAASYYGSAVAAPVFRTIAEATLRHLGVPRTINPEPSVLVARHGSDETRPRAVPATAPDRITPVTGPPTGSPRVPDLAGLSARDALRQLTRLGMSARMEGVGVVVEQVPEPGAPAEPGLECWIRLERLPKAGPAGSQP